MYIDEIDNTINDVIDDFYISLKKLKINDFNQTTINKLLDNYFDNIDLSKIKTLIKNVVVFDSFIDILKKYVVIYLFLTFGYFSHDEKLFVKNVVDFSNNQQNFHFKINNFFNPTSNALIMKNYTLLKNIEILLTTKNKEELKNNVDFIPAINFLNNLGLDFINNHFKLKNKNNSLHNIIKTILIVLYKKTDKIEIFNLIDSSQHEDDVIFIDVVISEKKQLELIDIKNTLQEEDKYLYNSIWKFLNDPKEILLPDDKILILLNSHVIVPIVDNLLLYHKDMEKYDKLLTPQEKLKSDTRAKYIVNKINTSINLYNPQKSEEAKKFLYAPLSNRRAIIVNNIEDIKIINKFLEIDKPSTKITEHFQELSTYMSYPYIEFKDFKKYGFSMLLNKTINVIRDVNFTTKQFNPYQYLQINIGNKIINITGFVIPSNSIPIQCLKIKNLIDITTLSSNKNGFDLFITYLKETFLNTKLHNASIYWLFNLELDKFKSTNYEQTNTSLQDKTKQMIVALYDSIENELFIELTIILKNYKYLTLQKAFGIIKNFELQTIQLQDTNELEKQVYSLITISKNNFDELENKVYGFFDFISLPLKPKNEKSNLKTIELQINKKKQKKIYKKINGICQHFLEKDRDINFYMTYVIENENQDYVCKSCGTVLDIKKYLFSGIFDTSKQQFIPSNIPIVIPLETTKGYEEYNVAIKQLDKIIERIAVISNMIHLLQKDKYVTKLRKREIIKNTIDMITLNNRYLNNLPINHISHVNKTLSIQFPFTFDNNIFILTPKETDIHKSAKQNNMLAYLIISLIVEINDSQFPYIGMNSKECGYPMFNKLKNKLFNNIKIIKNKAGDLDDISNYQPFCYLLFSISCYLVKYKMWFSEINNNLQIQKIIINTTIDIINNILEIDIKNNAIEMFKSKFFNKLSTSFNNDMLLKKLELKSSEKKELIEYSKQSIKLNKFSFQKFSIPKRINEIPNIYHIEKLTNEIIKHFEKTYITNCKNGEFHKWEFKNRTFICSLCSLDIKNATNEKLDNQTFKHIYFEHVATDFCKVKNIPILNCSEKLTNYDEFENYLNNESKIENDNTIKQQKIINNNHTQKIKYTEKVIKLLKKSYDKNYIKNLMSKMPLENVGLLNNVYIIDHNFKGILLTKPIIISENDNKIFSKKEHPFFKVDVIYYIDKSNKVTVFYDAKTKFLIGYKVEGKQFVKITEKNKKLIIDYSLYDKIKFLGYQLISDKYTEIEEKQHIENIKKTLMNLQRIIFKIVFNSKTVIDDEEKYFSSKYNKIINNYIIKLSNLIVIQNNHRVFKHWKAVFDGIIDGNLLLFYLVSETIKLIDYNPNNRDLYQLIFDFYTLAFETFNIEKYNKNLEMKKFWYKITSETYVLEVEKETTITGLYSDMTDEELKKQTKKKEQEIEETTALDVGPVFDDDEQDDDMGETPVDDITNENDVSRIVYDPNIQYEEFGE